MYANWHHHGVTAPPGHRRTWVRQWVALQRHTTSRVSELIDERPTPPPLSNLVGRLLCRHRTRGKLRHGGTPVRGFHYAPKGGTHRAQSTQQRINSSFFHSLAGRRLDDVSRVRCMTSASSAYRCSPRAPLRPKQHTPQTHTVTFDADTTRNYHILAISNTSNTILSFARFFHVRAEWTSEAAEWIRRQRVYQPRVSEVVMARTQIRPDIEKQQNDDQYVAAREQVRKYNAAERARAFH